MSIFDAPIDPVDERLTVGGAKTEPLAARGFAAAIAVGVIGALIIWIVPGFVALIAEQAPLDDRHLGYVAAWDINSMAATIGITTFVIRRASWRMLVLLALGLILIGNLFTAYAHAFVPIVASRILAGAGEGIAVGVSFAALGRARNPDRAFAIYLVVGAVLSAALLALLPTLVERFGQQTLFIGIAASAALIALGIPWFPQGNAGREAAAHQTSSIDVRLAAAALIGVFLYFLAQGAMWSYFELIGQASGIGAAPISRALAFSTLAGIGGAALAGALPARWGRVWPIVLSGALSVFSFLLLMGHVVAPILLTAGVILTFAWNLSQPLLSGLCCEADREGRVVCAMGCIQTIGFGLGPVAAALLLVNRNFSPVIWMSATVLVCSIVLVAAGIRRHRTLSALAVN